MFSPEGHLVSYKRYCNCAAGRRVREETEARAQRVLAMRREQAQAARWAETGVPAYLAGMRLETSPQKEVAAHLTGLGRNGWVFLHGNYGRGKTGLAVGYLWHWTSKFREPGAFVTAPDLFTDFRSCYNRSGRPERDVIDRYALAPLLVLDDLGAESVRESDWLADRLYQVLGRRHDAGIPTVITSNLDLQALAAKIGERVTWRIYECCGVRGYVCVEGPNLRERQAG